MAERPTVSVIIPTYNRAYLIDRSVQSVLNQTYQDFELIIVDASSIDSTEKVIIDIKSILDKNEIAKEGYGYWRL